MKLWDLRSNTLLQHYPAHADAISNITFHESGNYVLSSGLDGSLKIWDLREGQLLSRQLLSRQLLYTLHGHQGACTASAFAPTGSFFASGGEDKMVMVWKSALSTIVGGGAPSGGSGAPGESVNVTATKPRMAASGASLSYNSPARKDRPQTAPNTALSRSTRMNASSASSPVRGGGGGAPLVPVPGA
jgi:centriolar protein POC1